MNTKKFLSDPQWAYVGLLLISLGIPFLHWRIMDGALEYTRFMGGLMPANYLMLKWLGKLSRVAPAVFLGMFLASRRAHVLNSFEAVACSAIAYALCSSLYACYASIQFAMWLQGFR